MNVLEQRLAKQEQELPDKIDALKSNVTSQLEEKIAKTVKQDKGIDENEDKEIEKRKNNMIIYRIPDSADERNDGDMVYVTELLENVFQVKPEANGIEKMFRLGRKVDTSDVPRF